MTDARSRRRSIDELLAEARAQLDRVESIALATEVDAGAVIVDIRPVEQRTRDGELPAAIVIATSSNGASTPRARITSSRSTATTPAS